MNSAASLSPKAPPHGFSKRTTSAPLRLLGLSPAPVLVVLASDRGEHVEHHGVEGGEHARGELVAGRRKLPACRKVERDDADLAGVQFGAQLAPVRVGQTREAINLLDNQHVAGF